MFIPLQVETMFNKLTFDAIRSGRRRYSAVAIMNRLRWHFQIDEHDDTFKINNNWGALLSRRFTQAYPEHSGFFEQRPSKWDNRK